MRWYEDYDGIKLWVVYVFAISIISALFIFLGYIAKVDNENWEHFKRIHNCRKIGETSGTVDSAGHYTPGQEGWLCDDGVTYWR